MKHIYEQGLEYMQLGKFKKAIAYFTKVLEMDKTFFFAANNLALCLFLTGKIQEAVRVQSQSLEDSPISNPFGFSNFSMFFQFLGDDQEAEKAAVFAASLKTLNVEATMKVCETLAKFRRHQDIIKAADASDFGGDPYVRFYTGVASANLGDRKRAIEDLSSLKLDHVKAKLAQEYLQHLKNNTAPNTVRKDWPYLLPEEFYVHELNKASESSQKYLKSCRVLVDFAEAMLNAGQDFTDEAMTILQCCSHPEAVALLLLIMHGSFGSDQLRLHAASILAQKGEIKSGDKFEMSHDGKSVQSQLLSIRLNPEFVFGRMPPGIRKQYKKLVMAAQAPFADWPKIAKRYERLLPEAPHFYPLRYNYAVSLINCSQEMAGEGILRSLVVEHPEYLFAHASLLSILVHARRMAEAEKIAQRTDFPKETHPDAYVAWLNAMTQYHEARGENYEAFQSIKLAHEIAPDNPHVALLWLHWRDFA
ncbi:MAG: tetratricopeptide repeat protein [Lentisphaeria bacterium]|nr:tetratricopeptide repeat protein [Lentisphaeria bacterium]